MTETKSGGRQLKGDMAGSEEVSVEPFHSHKNVKKKWRLHSRPSLSIVCESAAMYSGWSGTEKKDRKVLQNLCGSSREICDGSSAQQSCVFGQRAAERSSVLLRKLQTDATLPPAAHCSLRHVDARLYLYTFQILQKIKVSNRFLLLQT